jgi:hypothetical protein
MKLRVIALLSGVALVAAFCLTVPTAGAAEKGQSNPFVSNVEARCFTVSGKLLSARTHRIVVRIDDGGHRIPFDLGPGVSADKLRSGKRVSVRYHPKGATGQVADEVKVH